MQENTRVTLPKPLKPIDEANIEIRFLYRFAISSSHWRTIIYYLCYQTFLTNFGGLYLTEFLTDFGQILDSNSYDQAQQTLWYHTTPRP